MTCRKSSRPTGARSRLWLVGALAVALIVAALVGAAGASADPSSDPARWAFRFGDQGTLPNDVATDRSSAFVAGSFNPSVNFGGGNVATHGNYDAFVASYDASNGAYRWGRGFGGIRDDFGFSVAATDSGRTIVAGEFTGPADFGGGTITAATNNTDVFLSSYASADGSFQWQRRLGMLGFQCAGPDMTVTPDGSTVLVTGAYFGSADFGSGPVPSGSTCDGFLAAYSASNGSFLWLRHFEATGHMQPATVAVGANGNIALAGGFQGTATLGGSTLTATAGSGSGNFSAFFASFTSSGAHRWSRAFTATGSQASINASSLAVTGGAVFLATNFGGGSVDLGGPSTFLDTNGNGAVSAYDPDSGNQIWQRQLKVSRNAGGVFLGARPDGNITLSLNIDGPVSLGGANLPYSGVGDVAVASYEGANGAFKWSRAGGGTGSEVTNGIANLPSGDILLPGTFRNSFTLASTTVTTTGSFLYRLPGDPNDSLAPETTDDLTVSWANHPVTVHLSATDADSGVNHTNFQVDGGPIQIGNVLTIPAPADGSNDGPHLISYYSVDNAGNIELPLLISVWIDTVAPQITPARSPLANAAGWNNSDVSVSFDCTDDRSGVLNCTPTTIFGPGTGQSIIGTVTDRAGNSAQTTVSAINVDETAPELSGAPTSSANANGWYSGDVAIHWTCSDDRSGLQGACPANSTITGEGVSLRANESISDLAGNSTSAFSVPPVSIDTSAPVTSASAPTGWSNTGITVTLSPLDNLSGVDSTFFRVDGGIAMVGTSVTIDDDGSHTISFWSSDRAGNVEAAHTETVLIDKTAPTISHTLLPTPNLAGWNTADVTVSFHCLDSLSGISFCTSDQTLSSDGASQPVHGEARDFAGNSAADTAYVSIDRVKPTISTHIDQTANAAHWFNVPVAISYSCDDLLSGIASCSATDTVGEGSDQSRTGTARDAAGNEKTVTVEHLNVDTHAPVVQFSGQQPSYTIADTINISCTATDNLSGVASSSCPSIHTPASSFFNTSPFVLSGNAVDVAGNPGSASISFTVTASSASLEALIRQLFGGDTLGANGLITKIANFTDQSDTAAHRAKALNSFVNQVHAKTPSPLSAPAAALLIQVATSLCVCSP